MRAGFFIRVIFAASLVLMFCHSLCAAEKLRVISTTTILDDFVRNVGGGHVEAGCLLRPGMDSHSFDPAPGDVQRLAGVDMVVCAGLGLETWLDKLLRNSGFRGTIVVASKGITALESAAEENHDHEHHHGERDPHVWQNPANAVTMVENIRNALCAADEAHAAEFKAAADRYIAELRALDAWAKRQFASLPKAQRKMVTSHDAFQYLGKAYGVEIKAIAGFTTEQEVDARHIASVVKFIKAQAVKGVFFENVSNPKMIEQIARDAGVKLGGELYSDSLGPADQPTGTYIGMFRSNVQTILDALR